MDSDKPVSYTKSQAAVTQDGSALQKYQQIIVGRSSFIFLIYYEFCMWLSGIPGALGLFLRKKFWPRLFGSCGKGVLFSSHIIIRHPHRIHIGNNVIISERCILDARTDNSEQVITLGDNVILSNDVALTCKGGCIQIGNDVGVGMQTVMQSTYDCPINVCKDTMIGPRCYFVAGGSYKTDRTDIPMRLQGIQSESGIEIGEDVWFGANVTVLSSIQIGKGSIIGAAAVVTKSVKPMSICVGNPAKVLRLRQSS
jgi:acetyltransferase-like isoleucine patch superfamily enzyme